jgi:chemotaxis protein methyltransferase CheR
MEPYSIAMTMMESIPSLSRYDARILATDIDTDMLARGRAGIYRAADSDGIPDKLRSKYVQSVVGGREPQVEMDDKLKKLIAFKPLNLMNDWPMRGPFDIIFCRNVVIYFDKPTQARLFNRYANLLRPGGLLYIGHSESLFNVTDRFKLVGRTIYQRVV